MLNQCIFYNFFVNVNVNFTTATSAKVIKILKYNRVSQKFIFRGLIFHKKGTNLAVKD